MRALRVLGGAVAVVVLGSSAADAATVAVRTNVGPSGSWDELAVVAAPGEANQVVLRFTPGFLSPADSHWTVSDSGVVLVPGESCAAIDAHAVRCGPRPTGLTPHSARVELGDMDDNLTAEGNGGLVGGSVSVDGGAGNDRLLGAEVLAGGPGDDELVGHPLGSAASFGNRIDGGPGNDRLVGGGGSDELRGGGGIDELNGADGPDRMYDDDIDGAVGEAGPGPDRFDGGTGTDLVSYERRTAAVIVDLADRSTDGERGEGDRLTNVESLTGGGGDDRLAGDDWPNVLDGQRGSDRMRGRGGSDELLRAEGPVSCGAELDTFRGGLSSRDFLEPDCEVLAPDYGAAISANPVAVFRRSVRFRIQCPLNEEGDGTSPYRTCGPGALRLREAEGRRRTLASGHFPAGRWPGRFVHARLTAVGQRLAARRRGVSTRVRIAGYYPQGRPLRWTIRLKVPD